RAASARAPRRCLLKRGRVREAPAHRPPSAARWRSDGGTLLEKIAVYQRANKEVAIICNHQRSVSKSHDSQMTRLNEKIDELKAQRDELKVDLSKVKKGRPLGNDKDGKPKRNLALKRLKRRYLRLKPR
ncbi:hypothetical protein E2562_024383, partial [Oryza meyeriana var. granulata]